MATYTYTAVERSSGRERRGSIEGSSRAQASNRLKAQGLAPTTLQVEPIGPAASGPARPGGRAPETRRAFLGWRGVAFGPEVSRRGLMLFTRQLATLVNAGLPLTRGLEILGRQERSPRFRRVLEELTEGIGAGGMLSDGLRQRPRLFGALYVGMVQAGEAGGVLGVVLDRLAHFLEKTERLRGRVKTALIYPAILMTVAAGIMAVLLVLVVPKFELIFSGLLRGQPLPAPTRVLLGLSAVIREQAGLILAACVLLGFGLQRVRQTVLGARLGDRLILLLPLLGDLVLKAAIARFTRTLGTLLASGVAILEALALARATCGHAPVAAALTAAQERIKQGDGLARSLEATAVFPGLVTGMMAVGEETGSLPPLLGRLADIYDEEVDNAVAGLTALLEPILVVLMALMVGFIVIALFLPIVSVIQHLQ